MKLILPVFCLALLGFSVATVSASDEVGQSVYTKSCAACHASGAMGAPKVGDKDAWAGLIAEGEAKLTHNAINGDGKMPPKGGNMQLTDAEVKAAVVYMMEKSK
jgi:cytochrome c5